VQLEHYKRIEEGANEVYHLTNLSPWIEKNIRLDGKLMSMSNHYKFQADIVNDNSRVNNTVKPAQIGLTTTTMAYFLAGMATQERFHVIYSLPTTNDAVKLCVTKIDPLIGESTALKNLVNVNVDSTELKQIGRNFLYIRGSRSETAALSVSADVLVADEIDRSDPDKLKQFRSRLQASELAIIRQFSTPTIPGVGISKEAETSKRYRHMATCGCCNHTWLPDYFNDVVIPGYSNSLDEITKYTIKDIRWQDAAWKCPHCGKNPRLHHSRLQWVLENTQDNYEAHTYYVTPVTAYKLLTPAYMVRTSTEFNTQAEWKNQVLGETAEDSKEQLTDADLDAALVQADLTSSEVHYFGADMGLLCHIVISRETQMGELLVVHREAVPLERFIERRNELIRLYRCAVSNHDVYPYTSMIMGICDYDPNAYGSIFTSGKSPELFTVQEKREDAEEGKLNLRLLKVNRTRGLDDLMELFKKRKILIKKQSDDEKLKEHVLSMKRTQVFVKEDLVYIWQKSTAGEDHYMFAMLYSYLACKLRGTVEPTLANASGLVSAFKVKT